MALVQKRRKRNALYRIESSMTAAFAISVGLLCSSCKAQTEVDKIVDNKKYTGSSVGYTMVGMSLDAGGPVSGHLDITPETRFCLMGRVTLTSPEASGVNAVDEAKLLSLMNEWLGRELYEHGQGQATAARPHQSRIESGGCQASADLTIRVLVQANAEGEPYNIRLTADQSGERRLAMEINRDGLVDLPGNVPVGRDGRLPDGRPYWSITGDVVDALADMSKHIIWVEG